MSVNKDYATTATVRRAISAVKSAGMQIGSVELMPGGAIRIVPAKQLPPGPANEFDRWEASGLL